MSVRFKKKRDVTESRYGQNYFVTFFSASAEQVDDQGMRDGKDVNTIRDSCYHKGKGAEKTWWGGLVVANTPKVR